ncbi:MAG: CapA family protein [Firmicutes bacterium]|nr:CapA family protein [Bacillota bacterium]
MKQINRKVLPVLLAAGFLLAGCGKSAAAPETEPVPEPTAVPSLSAQTESLAAETQPPETNPPEEHFLLTFAGDCTFGSNPVNYYAGYGFIQTVGEDYAYPFANVIEFFKNDEFTMVNLEGALCDQGNPMQKRHVFRGPTAYVSILTENSVEAVTLANNHAMDYGQSGYNSTKAALDAAGVPYVERDSSTVVTTQNGLTIGLYGAAYYDLDTADMASEVAAMRNQGVDLIVVAPHWGVEGTYHPTDVQQDFAHAAIDAGADIVFGTHPHVLQPIESYNGGVILYSLGNFSFGGNGYPQDYDTALVQQEVIRDASGNVTLGQLTVIPACVSSIVDRNNYQPTPYEPGSPEYDRTMSKLDGTFTGQNLKIG